MQKKADKEQIKRLTNFGVGSTSEGVFRMYCTMKPKSDIPAVVSKVEARTQFRI
jgi:uncharacterized protein (UPF0333 family)